MKPNTRALLLQTAFLPMTRTIDNRAHTLRKAAEAYLAEPPAPAPAAVDWAELGPRLAEAVKMFWALREKQLLALGYASVAEYEALCKKGDEHLALRDAIALLPA